MYDAIKGLPDRLPHVEAAPEEEPAPPINWAIWRERSEYSFEEFAMVLAKDDPAASSMSPEAESFQRLLIEAAERGDLRARRPTVSDGTRLVAVGHSYKSRVGKVDAVAWAESKQFVVDHIK